MRFVSPETEHIDLADGPDGTKNWIDVKKVLSKGEELDYLSASSRYVSRDEDDEPTPEVPGAQVEGEEKKKKRGRMRLDVDLHLLPLHRVKAYLVEWSATRINPQTQESEAVPITIDALRQLHPADFDEIADAVRKHSDRKADEKKAPTGLPKPTPPTP